MIQKPPANWFESNQVVTAVQSTSNFSEQAVSAGKRGVSVLRGVCFGFFALLWGYAGLAQIVFGSFGAGFMTLLFAAIPAFFAKKFLWPNGSAVQKQQPSSYVRSTASTGMGRQDVKSGLFRLILTIIFGIPFILIGVALLYGHDAVVKVVGLAIFVWSGYIWLKALRSLFSGGVVFYFDNTGITVPGLLGNTFIPWSDVKGFSAKTINTYAYYGLVKIASDHILYVERHMGRKVKLPTRHTGINLESIRDLVARMELLRSTPQGSAPQFSYDAQPYAPAPHQDTPATPAAAEPAFSAFGKARPTTSGSNFASRPSASAPATFGRRPTGFVSKS